MEMTSTQALQAVGTIVIGTLLSGCSGFYLPVAPQGATSSSTAIKAMTFEYTGARQSFSVPPGVTHVTITASGAGGGGRGNTYSGPGIGAWVRATIPVTPGETLFVFVGGRGANGTSGGFNGGGAGGKGDHIRGNGGGGASDVRRGGDRLMDRVIVAAGAGGIGATVHHRGEAWGGSGGFGGGRRGFRGGPGGRDGGTGGGGATHRIAGAGGAGANDGKETCTGTAGGRGGLGIGGSGGDAACHGGGSGAGGGGGYYGGGGAGSGGTYFQGTQREGGGGGGGGGGSSFAEKTATRVTKKAGRGSVDNGKIFIAW